jgi:lysophospholipase L1-like esterase
MKYPAQTRYRNIPAYCLFAAIAASAPCPAWAQTTIPQTDRNIQLHGRWRVESNVPEAQFAGNQIVARVTGTTSIGIRLQDTWNTNGDFYAFLNDNYSSPVHFTLANADGTRNNSLQTKTLFTGLSASSTYTVRVVRLGSYYKSSVAFQGFVLSSGGSLVAPPARKSRRIEFWGDSITEGTYQNSGPSDNAWIGFGPKTARALNADYVLVSRSGLGLFQGYQLPATLKTQHLSTTSGDKTPGWNFLHQRADTQPHLLVINIGQNDFWTAKATSSANLVNHYREMAALARAAYPHSHLLFAIGGMDLGGTSSDAVRWRTAINDAINQYRTATGDTKISRFDFADLGQGAHPQDAGTTTMANALAAHINNNLSSVWSGLPTAYGRVEAENLTPAAGGIATTVELHPGAHAGATRRADPSSAGQSVTFTLPARSAATYTVRVWLRRANSHGIVRVAFNGSTIADNLDLYRAANSNTLAYFVAAETTWTSNGSATPSLVVTSLGKNASASNDVFAIDSIEFIGGTGGNPPPPPPPPPPAAYRLYSESGAEFTTEGGSIQTYAVSVSTQTSGAPEGSQFRRVTDTGHYASYDFRFPGGNANKSTWSDASLVFKVRTTGTWEIGVRDATGANKRFGLGSYIAKNGSWETATVPLSHFTAHGVNLSQLEKIYIYHPWVSGQTLDLDDVLVSDPTP